MNNIFDAGFRILTAAIFCLVLLPSFAWTQDAPQPHRTGRYSVRFTQRDPRSGVAEANRRFGEGVRFNPAACKFDHSSESYEVYVPQSYDPSKRFGLIVWINAGDDGGIPPGYEELLDKHRLIWIGANNGGNDRSPFWIRAMLAIDGASNIKHLYNIDSDRVYVSGISGGGRVASMVALTFPDVFSGGAYYVIGCNYMKNLATSGNKFAPGFWTKPDPRILEMAHKRRFAMITGSEDFNKPGTERVFKGYKNDGFQFVTFLEQPGLGHRLPDAQWYEKGILALDQPLVEAAPAQFKLAVEAEQNSQFLEAFRSYVFAATHGRGQSFHETATGKVADFQPQMSGLSEQAYADLPPDSSSVQLRQFVRQWYEYPIAKQASQRANELGVKELADIESLDESSLRPALGTFLQDWAGYQVYGQAIDLLNNRAMDELKRIRARKYSREKVRQLKRFATDWEPSPVVGLARLDLENLAAEQLELIKSMVDIRKRRSKLVGFLDDFPDTKAHTEAVQILNSSPGRRN